MTDQVKAAVFLTAGALIGASTTYLVVKERLKTKYETYAEEEIESVRLMYKKKVGEYVEAQEEEDAEREAREAFHEQMQNYNTQSDDDDIVEEEYVHVKKKKRSHHTNTTSMVEDPEEAPESHLEATLIGDLNGVVMDLDLSQEERSEDFPYVIAAEEYFSGDSGNDLISISYFEDGNTLVDERQEILDIEDTIGTANLLRFGHGSDDPNIVYIRNERDGSDFEVAKCEGTYAQWTGQEPLKVAVPTDYAKKHKKR